MVETESSTFKLTIVDKDGVQRIIHVRKNMVSGGQLKTFECPIAKDTQKKYPKDDYVMAWEDTTKKLSAKMISSPNELMMFAKKLPFTANDDNVTRMGNVYFMGVEMEDDEILYVLISGNGIQRIYNSLNRAYEQGKSPMFPMLEPNVKPFFDYDNHVLDFAAWAKKEKLRVEPPFESQNEDSDDDFNTEPEHAAEPAAEPTTEPTIEPTIEPTTEPAPETAAEAEAAAEAAKEPASQPENEATQPAQGVKPPSEAAVVAKPKKPRGKKKPTSTESGDADLQEDAPQAEPPSTTAEGSAAQTVEPKPPPKKKPAAKATPKSKAAPTEPEQPSTSAMDVSEPVANVAGQKRSAPTDDDSTSVFKVKKACLRIFGGFGQGLITKLAEDAEVGWDKEYKSISIEYTEEDGEQIVLVKRKA